MPNIWTIESLKEYFERLLEQHDRQNAQRFSDSFNAVQSALASAKEAVIKAEAASDRRFESVNEFRATLADWQRTTMPRAEAEALLNSINAKLTTLTNTVAQSEGKSVGSGQMLGYIVGGLGVAAAVFTLLLKFAK